MLHLLTNPFTLWYHHIEVSPWNDCSFTSGEKFGSFTSLLRVCTWASYVCGNHNTLPPAWENNKIQQLTSTQIQFEKIKTASCATIVSAIGKTPTLCLFSQLQCTYIWAHRDHPYALHPLVRSGQMRLQRRHSSLRQRLGSGENEQTLNPPFLLSPFVYLPSPSPCVRVIESSNRNTPRNPAPLQSPPFCLRGFFWSCEQLFNLTALHARWWIFACEDVRAWMSVWERECAREGGRETLTSDWAQHVATVKLLTFSPSFRSGSCEDLYLPISRRDVSVADQGLGSRHPHWCFVTWLSTVSPSCFIFHMVHQTCLSHHPRRKTVMNLNTEQPSFYYLFSCLLWKTR